MLKGFFKSKTMNAALVLQILGVVQANSDFLSTVLSPSQFGYMMIGIGVLMQILRAMTTSSIGEK